MSEAKVCKVCGREDCGVARFGAGTSVASAHVRYLLGYERERAAREKAEAERDAARRKLDELLEQHSDCMPANSKAWNDEMERITARVDGREALEATKDKLHAAEADLAQARKELAEANKHLLAEEERRKLTGDALHAEGLLIKAEADRDAAIRLLREAKPFLDSQHAIDVEAEGGPCAGCDCCEQIKAIDAFLDKHPAATGDTPPNLGAGRLSGSVAPAVPATGRRTMGCEDAQPEPAGRSEDEAETLRGACVLLDSASAKNAIRAALAAAERRGLERAAEACLKANRLDGAYYATMIRAKAVAAEPEKAS